MGQESREIQIQGMLAKSVIRKHTLVLCTVGLFLNRLLGDTLPGNYPSSAGEDLDCWFLLVFCIICQSLSGRVQLPNPSELCFSAPPGICWEVKPISPWHKAWSGSRCEGRTRTSMSLVGLGLVLRLHPHVGTMEAMPKLVLNLREFEMTGGIQRWGGQLELSIN